MYVGTITPGKLAVAVKPNVMPTLQLNSLLSFFLRDKNEHARQKTNRRMSIESYLG